MEYKEERVLYFMVKKYGMKEILLKLGKVYGEINSETQASPLICYTKGCNKERPNDSCYCKDCQEAQSSNTN